MAGEEQYAVKAVKLDQEKDTSRLRDFDWVVRYEAKVMRKQYRDLSSLAVMET